MDKKAVRRVSKILEPTEEQKEQMLSNILNKQKNDATKKKGRSPAKRLKPALVAAVLAVCLLTTTAFAAAYVSLNPDFLEFLKPSSPEQAEYLANGAYTVDKSVKNKNGALDIRQVIGDSNVTLILMDFTAPKGTVLNQAYYSFQDTDIDFGSGFANYEIISMKDDNVNDNRISLVLRVKTNDSLMGQDIQLKLTNFCSADTWPGELTTLFPGEWKTSFKLDFKNYSTAYQVDKLIKMFNYEAKLKSISISPVSITLKLRSDFAEEISKASGNWEMLGENKYSDPYPITIHYKDGTSETTNIFHGMKDISFSLGDMVFVKTFDNVINDKEIKSIEFFDTEIKIAP